MVSMVPQGVQPRPWLLGLTSPFTLQTPHSVFPSSVRWVQCRPVEASGLLGETPPLLSFSYSSVLTRGAHVGVS